MSAGPLREYSVSNAAGPASNPVQRAGEGDFCYRRGPRTPPDRYRALRQSPWRLV